MADGLMAGRRVLVTGGRASLVSAIGDAARAAGATVMASATDDEAPDVVVIVTPPSDGTPFLAMTDAAWSASVARRILEPVRLAREAAVGMRRRSGGTIVLVGTLDASHAYAGHADASVAMGALGGLVRTLALELAPDGIRTNLVLAGPLDDGPPSAGSGAVERTLLRSPSGRFVRAEEVAAAVLFVAGPDAAFMTGASLRVDAGWSALNQAPDGMRFA